MHDFPRYPNPRKRRMAQAKAQEVEIQKAQRENPFVTGFNPLTGEATVQAVDAESRLHMVKSFELWQCHAALKVPGLQLTVQNAIERRIRQIKRQAAARIEEGS